ncbi:SigE family RNA polymerase sigma factor [Dactylosporangium sp. NPDC005555]|uniref:SigE family RNA polymerase sigma factor n=1 Tax=Dactylosporangium sp. NPDC005555 TaxID=3154889 RepID=UPI0033A9E6A9
MTFEEFVAVRLPALLRQATALAGDPHLAEDVVQDVLIKAQPRWARICELDVPERYVRKMIVNELLSARRRVAAAIRRERAQPPVREQEQDRAEQVTQRDALVRLIRALPPRQRIVIALRYYEDMADGDIAALMGCSLATVRSQASRALAKLRSVAELQPVQEER